MRAEFDGVIVMAGTYDMDSHDRSTIVELLNDHLEEFSSVGVEIEYIQVEDIYDSTISE